MFFCSVLDAVSLSKMDLADNWCLKVPPGHVYLVGDNLPWSRDSRTFGPVPLGLVNGKVVARVWPLSKMEWVKNTLQPMSFEEAEST